MENRRIAWEDELVAGSLDSRFPSSVDPDPFGTKRFLDSLSVPGAIQMGMVVTYSPQTHTASVFIITQRCTWSCKFADERLSYSFGFSETHPPREGETVLVWEDGAGSRCGIVIGRLAYPWNFTRTGDKYGDPDGYNRSSFTQNRDTSNTELPLFKSPLENKNDDSTHLMTHFRPTDIYPGEFANLNQHNCGIKGGLFSATLLGGGASLRMSALSNLARLTCESYQRYSMAASLHEFHNGRYLSSERNTAIYQEERLGGSKPQDTVWTEDAESPVEGENQTMCPRMKELSGYFGNLSAKFCLRPNTDNGIRVQEYVSINEEGVSRETVDPSGQYRLSAAGMIAIERTGRIPVPVRTCYPTDKGHDIESNLEKLKLKPFEHDDSDPGYRQLELFDRQAYDLKNQYARVDGLGTDDPDYYVPQEEELDPLEDKYDKKFTGSETVKLNKYDKRRAGMYIGEDGSVIVRDAWGSEIVMLGGNVTIACAGNVMLLPGKTQLTIAGDDIVQKAQNSIDIHASAHDVRLSAARNMEILGGGDERQYSGGVIIESRGNSVSPWNGENKGESAGVSGITLKTKNQGVVIDGQRVIMRSKDDTRIISGDKSIDGNVSISAKTLRARSKSTIMSTGKSSISLNDGGAYMVGTNVGLGGGDGLIFTEGEKIRVPFKMEDAEINIYKSVNSPCDKGTEPLSREKDAAPGFDRQALDKMMFGFRTSEECGTTKSWMIGGPNEFRLYEPAWVQVMRIYETLKNGRVDATEYEDKPEWENGKPFPGKEVENKAKYIKLSGSKPHNLTSEGFNLSRVDVENKSEINSDLSIKKYLVRK